MNDLNQYFDAYAEDALSDDERAALRAWLGEDQEHVDEFVRDAFVHWQLLAIGQRKSLQADVSETPGRGLEGLHASVAAQSPASDLGSRRGEGRRLWGAMPALAALLAVTVGLVLWSALRPAKPVVIAQLTKATPDLAGAGASMPAPGGFLSAGQVVEIDRGRLLTTLASGVQIVLEGPAKLRLDSGERVFFERGRMTVLVPRQASGFVADSPLGRFIDLGTEYTLKLHANGGCELHVFSGLVEVRPNNAELGGPLVIPEGRSMSYEAGSSKVSILPYRVEERMTM